MWMQENQKKMCIRDRLEKCEELAMNVAKNCTKTNIITRTMQEEHIVQKNVQNKQMVFVKQNGKKMTEIGGYNERI